jgi:hypothetical protein
LLELLIAFLCGFLSDFWVVKYYEALTFRLGNRAVVFNTLIFTINVLFIGTVKEEQTLLLVVFLLGQNAGIKFALWFNGGNIARRNACK